jgi:hypothetical protein
LLLGLTVSVAGDSLAIPRSSRPRMSEPVMMRFSLAIQSRIKFSSTTSSPGFSGRTDGVGHYGLVQCKHIESLMPVCSVGNAQPFVRLLILHFVQIDLVW